MIQLSLEAFVNQPPLTSWGGSNCWVSSLFSWEEGGSSFPDQPCILHDQSNLQKQVDMVRDIHHLAHYN